ncbi:hypothetical protein HS088_TW06G00196 [Tripterygium wilfordii]|uniref:Uncharacterized protein n=1 Tax=Tripterygium wilfordii TaxID=458696 RepID=A0A7J7DI54_TRIWF|nr:hypothetical protein HS088_TW06G00196 [Tripterygium wilfordii]
MLMNYSLGFTVLISLEETGNLQLYDLVDLLPAILIIAAKFALLDRGSATRRFLLTLSKLDIGIRNDTVFSDHRELGPPLCGLGFRLVALRVANILGAAQQRRLSGDGSGSLSRRTAAGAKNRAELHRSETLRSGRCEKKWNVL